VCTGACEEGDVVGRVDSPDLESGDSKRDRNRGGERARVEVETVMRVRDNSVSRTGKGRVKALGGLIVRFSKIDSLTIGRAVINVFAELLEKRSGDVDIVG
jgi:hypothetical protein